MDYILNISHNYLHNKSYKECIDCCKKAIKRYESYSIELNYDTYFKFLFNLYLTSYYHLGKEQAAEIVNKIKTLSDNNPYLRNVYLNNQSFYDNQFEYS